MGGCANESMKANVDAAWHRLCASQAAWHRLCASQAVSPRELRLENTLQNGQCFGWQRQQTMREKCADPVWVGVLGHRILALRQTETDCLFRCLGSLSDNLPVAGVEQTGPLQTLVGAPEDTIACVRSELQGTVLSYTEV